MPKPKFYGRRVERKALSRRYRRQEDKMGNGPAEQRNGNGDPHVHAPDPRSEQADTNGMMGAGGADSHQPGKEQPRGEVRKDSPDFYGVA